MDMVCEPASAAAALETKTGDRQTSSAKSAEATGEEAVCHRDCELCTCSSKDCVVKL